jgi:hypothetical protein
MVSASLENAKAAGGVFLETVDAYLAKHWRSTTCADLYEIFDNFRVCMRDRRGGIAGIHGLAEYLVLRFVGYQLGGDFTPPKLQTGRLSPLCLHPLVSPGGLRLTQGSAADGQTRDGGKTIVHPDLGIWRCQDLKSPHLHAAAEIKNCPTDRGAIRHDADQLSTLANRWKYGFRGVFILLLATKRHTAWIDELDRAKRDYPWFDFIDLQDNPARLADEFETKLGLGDLLAGTACRSSRATAEA